MQSFKTLAFSITLLAKLKASFWRMLLSFLQLYGSFLIVFFLAIVLVIGNFRSINESFSHSKSATISPKAPTSPLPQEIAYWQAALQKQPTSRDILLNLSLLYQANNQSDLAQQYKAKAQAVDPNYNFPQ